MIVGTLMPGTGSGRTRDERGVTYLMLMFAIVLIGISTTAAAKQWKAMVQRELEADLLSKGIEIQNALALYSATLKAGRVMPGELYPESLADLTRSPKPFLRKAYSDHDSWRMGISPCSDWWNHGSTEQEPCNTVQETRFPQAVRHFEWTSVLSRLAVSASQSLSFRITVSWSRSSPASGRPKSCPKSYSKSCSRNSTTNFARSSDRRIAESIISRTLG